MNNLKQETKIARSESLITRRDIHIAYDRFGDPQNPYVLLIMGLGAQMRVWPDIFCEQLASAGFCVVRFDNRDAGESSNFEGQGTPNIAKTWLLSQLKRTPKLPYYLDDMAVDVADIMTAFDLKSAHIIGASMGAMIGQIIAANDPQRVRSLTSIMTADQPPILRPKINVLLRLMQRPRCDSEHIAVRYNVMMNDLIGSPGFPMSDDEVLQIARTNYLRTTNQTGYLRQLAAVTSSGNRRWQLNKIKAPTLVIHGKDDPLIPPRMGRNVAKCIRNSDFHLIKGMGHNLPHALMPRLLPLITDHLVKAEQNWPAARS